MRKKLPDRRRCTTRTVKVNGRTVHFTVGYYEDGRPGELFIDVAKTGTSERSWCGLTAKLVSLMLQYRVPLHEVVEALAGHCSETFGEVPVSGHEMIESSCGIMDTVIRSMALEHLATDIHQDKAYELLGDLLRATEDEDATTIRERFEAVGAEDVLDEFLAKFVWEE